MTTTTQDEGLEVHESKKPLKVPPGYHNAHVLTIEDIVGKYGAQWQFTIGFDEFPEQDPPYIWAEPKVGTKGKLYRWATALLGRPLAIGEKITRTQLTGLPCRVLVEETLGATSGEYFNRITQILPVKEATAAKGTPETKPLPDKCFCGKPVHSYSSTGAPLCEKHTAEAMQE